MTERYSPNGSEIVDGKTYKVYNFAYENDFLDLIDLLNIQDNRIKELEHRIRELEYKSHINKPHWEKYEQNEGYTMETQQDIRFIERTNEALERVENSNREPMSADEFLKELDNW